MEQDALENEDGNHTEQEPVAEIDESKEAKKLKKLEKKKRKDETSKLPTEETGPKEVTNDLKSEKSKAKVPPHTPGNYIEHKSTSKMTTEMVAAYRSEASIVVVPEHEAKDFKPITKFEYLYPSIEQHCPHVTGYLEEKRFPLPTPIQVGFMFAFFCWDD